MVQVVRILAFIGAITGTASTFLNYPHHLNRLFGVNDEPDTEQSKENRSLCDSKQCQELAKILMEGMDESVDPCENFYEYACGNWKVHNPLPKNEKIWNLMKKTQSIVDKRLLDIIEQDPSPDDFLGLRLTKRAYKACMNADELDKNGLQGIVFTLARAGGWPLIMEEDEWDEQIYKWQQVDDYYARLIGLNSLHDLSVDLLDWENMKGTYLRVNNPHYPMRAYRLVGYDEDDMDDSDENNESGEGSQERGSEEEPNSEEIEVEDEDDKYQKQLQRRANKRTSVHRGKTKARKSTVRRTAHSVRQSKAKSRERSPKRMQRSLAVDKSLRKSIVRSKRRHEVANDDMYFDDVTYNASNDDDEENEEDNEEDEENGSGSGGYNDDDDEQYKENGSGSGDYNDDDEEDEENGSGSGGYYDDEYYERKRKEKQERERLKKEYAEYILNVSLALTEATGVSIPKEKLEEDIGDLINFQISLIKLIYKDDQGQNSTLRSLQKLYDDLKPTTSNGKIDWIKKVQDLFATGGMEIDDNVKILIPSNGYIKGFRKLLDRTPSRTIVNYIHWNFLSRVIQVTTKEMKDLYNNWSQKEKDPNTRSTECIEEIDAKYYLGYEYIKRHFPDEIRKTALDMIDDIEKEVEYQIEEATWMNNDARHFVLDKLMFMKKMIGYPKQYRNSTVMETYFRGLSITPSRFENFLSVKRYTKQQKLKLYYSMEEFTLSEFSLLNPLVVNAFFVPFMNTIEITAADLQNPLFEFHHPWYSNFGFIGYVMAHEVNHGFDSGGIVFDKEGNFMRLPDPMQEEYEKRAECFVAQYTKYSMEENRTANIPSMTYGNRTQEENIADSMGLQAAFKAYQRRQRKCASPDPMLPGLQNFTNEQVFFLSFANIWCEDIDLEKVKEQLMKDRHSLGPLRVIGSVSNSEDFSKAYNCPKGSPMNPIKKCNIWK
ncbi:neprilysin-2-like isoform X1 [Colletes gigas]|uniref:neprilysin-2-like isoform X1 n=1 Tax=Colletes gigas TaxID=935657 RepID=UPI001C9AB3EC|nr:neprilysin-2-like isoform X1 [Colletes gigas]